MSISIKDLYSVYLEHPFICTDNRKAEKGSMFFALKGDHFNGNNYAEQAIAGGCAYAIVDDMEKSDGERLIYVEEVLPALQELAAYHRESLNIPVLCITGTNGKTTTKDLTARILSKKLNVVATKGNLNNHIGVPLSLLTIGKDAEMAVIELGANHIKEIEFLCKIAKPTHGLITNIGKAHLEGFGDLDSVRQTKLELYQFLKSNDGQVFVNRDNTMLMDLSKGMNPVFYGSSEDSDCRGTLLDVDGHLKVSYCQQGDAPREIITSLLGTYNFENIMAAICIGSFFQVPATDIVEAVESYVPDNNRSEELDTDNNHIILDAYNANPMNMRAALESFTNLVKANRMVILGDMLELGTYAEEEHTAIVDLLREHSYERVILVGEEFSKVCTMLRCEHFTNVNDAKIWLESSPVSGMNILVKGSRGIGLEVLLEAL
ncbi:MAG TPA: UDP-N-acetylmuramoyl-tripeptide--D-alanyl-D-alanine ligase [Flavobacteriales bacterium]|nr:UDP-N-acetylmuramoyl-tripeptide--D-alanyl-D-alanine ligase [Flavobacteriales bacterium]HIO67883.1 UDP-N-acetylmuramoyl-tripeptide--D-alanyl-D-alanine ligase [Flavobacteriales bacterium]